MRIAKRKEEVVVKGVKLDVELSYYYDEEVKSYYDDEKLGNENLRVIRNAYRKKMNLLTDNEIKKIREMYNLNQRNFSLLLGFGEVTITRYESKSIQEKAHDTIIRNALDPKWFYDCAIKNKDLYLKYNSVDSYNNLLEIINNKINQDLILSGNIEYDEESFLGVVNYLVLNIKRLTKTILAKLLWYVDFLSYKEYNQSITGLKYIHNYYGAYPVGFTDKLSNEKILIRDAYCDINDSYVYIIESCKSDKVFDNEQILVMNKVIEKFKDYNTKDIVEYMHKEVAYTDTKDNELISYEYAKKLSISL